MSTATRIVMRRTLSGRLPWEWRVVTPSAVLASGYAPSLHQARDRARHARRLALGERAPRGGGR